MIPRHPYVDEKPFFKLSTSLALLGVLVEIIRERFTEGIYSDPALKWFWKSDLKTTGIFIESGWNENLEGRNVRPGIWIDRDQNVYGKVSVGDQDQMPVYKNVRLETFYSPGDVDVIIDCTSTKRGESMMIGSIVQDFLHMSSNVIQAFFGLRDMSPVILGRTVPFEKDDKLMNSPVTFRVQYENRWASAPIATTLHRVSLKISDVIDPEQYFREIALRVEPDVE